MGDTTKGLIPTLRFPEFKELWEANKVSQLTSRLVNPVAVDLDGEYREIGIRSHGKGLFHKQKITGSSLGNKRVFWVKPNCFIVNIVFAWEQAIAKTTEVELGFIASHRFPMYEPLASKANVDFLVYFFKRKKGKNILELASPGGAGRNKTLGQKEFEKTKLIIPKVVEQQKIANFLTSVDTKIQQLKRKHTLMQQYKKGVMQQLFSQQVRFKDDNGQDYPEWKEKQLGDVLTIGSGRDYKHLSLGDIPVYGTGGYMRSVDKYLYDGESVCIGRKGTIDKPVLLDGKFWTVDTLFYTHNFKGVTPKFIYAIFQQVNWKKHSEASGVPSLSKTTIEKIKVSFPCIDEQKRIAGFLEKIDNKLQQLNTQITQAEIFKKGLLQQMFV